MRLTTDICEINYLLTYLSLITERVHIICKLNLYIEYRVYFKRGVQNEKCGVED